MVDGTTKTRDRLLVRWVVVENTPGYMPESIPAAFTNRQDADRYAAELARELRDEGYSVSGSARDGGYSAERNADDLGRVIEISRAAEEEYIDQYGDPFFD